MSLLQRGRTASARAGRLGGSGAEAWRIHHDALAREAAGRNVIILSIGDPDFATPAAINQACKASLDAGRTHYSDVIGEPDLRRAIARHDGALQRRAIDPDQVIVFAGAQCALFAACQLVLDPGDEIVVPAPMYVTYPATIAASGAELVPVPVLADGSFALDLVALEAAVGPRTRAIMVNTPANPTGAMLGQAELEGLAATCTRHDLWLICDEVYATLTFDHEHRSPAGLPGMAERTLTISSLSKSHAMTGWRVGWLITPPALTEAAGYLTLAMLYGSPTFIQDAAVTALDAPVPEVADMLAAYRARRDLVCLHLANLPGVRPRRPAGGMFVMADVSGTGLTGDAFARGLLEAEDVAVLSGDAFGGPAAGHVRIGLVVGEARLAEACARIGRYARTLARAEAA